MYVYLFVWVLIMSEGMCLSNKIINVCAYFTQRALII